MIDLFNSYDYAEIEFFPTMILRVSNNFFFFRIIFYHFYFLFINYKNENKLYEYNINILIYQYIFIIFIYNQHYLLNWKIGKDLFDNLKDEGNFSKNNSE